MSNEFQAWLEEAKKLRAEHYRAQADFFMHLLNGEREEIHRKAAVAYASFVDCLKGENIVDVASYRSFVEAVDKFGFDSVRKYGVKQMREVLKVPSEAFSRVHPTMTAREAVVEDLRQSYERNGVPASDRQAETFRLKHYVKPEVRIVELDSDDPRRMNREALEREVKRLRLENAKLLKTIERLQKTSERKKSPEKDRSQTAL